MRLAAFITALLLAPAARADFGVNLYGLSWHLDADKAKEIGTDNWFNPGLGVRYRIPDERFDYYRIRHYLFPFHTLVGGDLDAPEFVYNAKCWVPMDDRLTLVLECQFLPGRFWTESEAVRMLEVRNPFDVP